MAVFPVAEGAAGLWADPLPGHRRSELLRGLAKLHQATSGLRIPRGPRPPACPRDIRSQQRSATSTTPGTVAPLAEPARQAFASHASSVSNWRVQLGHWLGGCNEHKGRESWSRTPGTTTPGT